MPVRERAQRLWGAVLDLVGIDRDPPWIGEYEASNRLQRSLCHVVIQDGQNSRLVKGTADGVVEVAAGPVVAGVVAGAHALVTLPLWGVVKADVVVDVSETDGGVGDLGDARRRCIQVIGPYGSDDTCVWVYESVDGEAYGDLIGFGTSATPCLCCTALRYVRLTTTSMLGSDVVKGWNLS